MDFENRDILIILSIYLTGSPQTRLCAAALSLKLMFPWLENISRTISHRSTTPHYPHLKLPGFQGSISKGRCLKELAFSFLARLARGSGCGCSGNLTTLCSWTFKTTWSCKSGLWQERQTTRTGGFAKVERELIDKNSRKTHARPHSKI